MENYDTTQDDRLWGMLSYLLGFFGSLIFGFFGFVGPLVVYVVKKGPSRFIAFHALQAVLMQVAVRLGILVLVMFFNLGPEFVFRTFLFLLGVNFVYAILGAIKAWDGEWYKIPVIGSWAYAQSGVNQDDGTGGDDSSNRDDSVV